MTGIPEGIMREAEIIAKEATRDAMRDPLMPYYITVAPHIARALLAAEKRGADRERERCIQIVTAYAAVHPIAGAILDAIGMKDER